MLFHDTYIVFISTYSIYPIAILNSIIAEKYVGLQKIGNALVD